MLRKIKAIHPSTFSLIEDLKTYSPLPGSALQQLDPFLLLNHHGPQVYPPHNNGMPFGPHPHRGMETVTFIMKGDVLHADSTGHQSVIKAGGVQHMTAGSGLLHAEVNSSEFKKEGGELEILQLWLNLPAKHKMAEPQYKGFQRDELPEIKMDKYEVQVLSGNWKGKEGAFQTITDVHLSTVYFGKGAEIQISIPAHRNIFFYVLDGVLDVNGTTVRGLELAEFERQGEEIEILPLESGRCIIGHAEPIGEPVVSHGPFVMNSMEEIYEAFEDFRAGKFGVWPHDIS